MQGAPLKRTSAWLLLPIVLIWFWPVSLGARATSPVVDTHALPLMGWMAEGLGEGRIPEWNSLDGSGTPALALSEIAPYSPQPQPVTIASDHGERIELSFHCDEPGIVVLTDQAYPGWTASRTLDGTKQPPAHVETAWGQWRMVRIPRAGDWIVRFEFAPTSSRLGRAVSLVAIAGWLELSGFYWWTRQDKGEPIHSCDTPELQSDEAPAGGQHPPEPHRTR